MYSIGVDIGASKISFVLMRKQRLMEKQKILTPKTKEEIIDALKKHIGSLVFGIPKRKISGIGIGIPGPLDKKRNLVLNPPNLTQLRNCFLAKIIEKEFKIETRMDNDANCFTLAESIMGAGEKEKVVVGITLGSGVGGGIVIKSKRFTGSESETRIYRGANGSAAEFGHMAINFNGPKCTCGNRGCLEEYCSEKFFKRKGETPKQVWQKAKNGSKLALETYNEYGKYLGIGLGNICNILDPEVIVIGGGIANAWRFFIKETKKEIRKRIVSPLSKKYVKIKKAELGEIAGAIGATFLLKTYKV